MTKKRQALLDALKRSGRAVSAKELHRSLKDIDLVTIYRNLELFAKEKMVAQVHFSDTETRYEYQQEPHHHAVCTNCEKVIHFTAKNEQLKRLLKLHHFDVDSIEVTVRGRCRY